MTREESATRSITHVRVFPETGEARLTWWPRPTGGAIDPRHPAVSLGLPLATVAPHR
jgi:hypothetical protein